MIFLTFLGYSCLNKDDKSGVQTYTEFYPDGSIKAEWERVDSIAHGKMTSYYATGKIESVMHFVNGEATGPAIFYYESGRVRAKNNYLRNRVHGERTQYYENGSVEFKGIFDNNRPVGEYFQFYEDGKIKAVYDYVIYDTSSMVNSFIQYSPNGGITAKSSSIKIVELNDKLSIEIEDKMFDKLRVVLGKFDKYFVLDGMESLDTINRKDNLTIDLPFHHGDTIRGVVDNYKLLNSDSGASKLIWFSYPRTW